MFQPNTSSPSGSKSAEKEYRVKKLQRDRLVTLLRDLNNETYDGLSHAELEVKLEFIETKINMFEQTQSELEYMDEDQFKENHRSTAETSYCSAKAKMMEILALRRSVSIPLSSTQLPHQEPTSRGNVHLPKLQLSKFDGQYKRWLDFYNMFSVLVDKNDSLSNIGKFQYLRSCLEGDAAQLIHSLEVTNTNYEMALDLLSSRYGNKRYIFNAHLHDIFNIERISNPNVSQLRSFIDTVNANLRAIQSFATKSQIADGILLHLVVSKFDLQTKTKWEEEITNNAKGKSSTALYLPDWDVLSEFLEKMCQTFDIIAHDKSCVKANQGIRKSTSFVVSETTCNLCVQPVKHSPFKCSTFTNLDPMASNCPSNHRCQECRVSHHTLLHREKQKPIASEQCSTPTVLSATKKCEIIIATALVEICTPSGKKIIARALLDSASQLHFVTERVAQFLRLGRHKMNIDILGIGSNTIKAYYQCSFNMKSLHYAHLCFVEAIILPTITGSQPHSNIDISGWCIPFNVKLADPKFNIPGSVDLLLGTGVFYELLMVGQIKLRDNLPLLQKTSLGWIVSGGITKSPPLSPLSPSTNSVLTTTFHNIDQLVEKFWIMEEKFADTVSGLSIEEQECEDYFYKTTTRCASTGKFIVRLSFKSSYDRLGDSYDIAYKRFLLLEKRLQQSKDIKIEYTKFINEYIELGHMQVVQKQTSLNFIPHHCVTKADSSSTKLRVVFDASCTTTSGVALNVILRVGPKLQDNLYSILFRFRLHTIVLMADITKMYRQVVVHPEDRKWQCILWRNSPNEPVTAYQLQTVTYGTSCASYLATKCLQRVAVDGSSQYPIGSKVAQRDFYVDNLMTGGNTIDEVIEIKRQVTALLETGGFPLRKFASNVSTILEGVTLSDREPTFQLYDFECIKALGLKWYPTHDRFLFNYEVPKISSKITKRKILSHIASFFDPLGLINPIIVTCKILMQELWKLKINWDESVPQSIATQWENLCQQLPHIDKIQIQRLVEVNTNFQIHAFADASTKAYGTCIYAVHERNGKKVSYLLCAKSRVAPTRPITLPRLELCATSLLTELLETVCEILKPIAANVHCWTDSSITLAWINGDPSRWTQFVANRVRRIQTSTSLYNWHHCPTADNPADLVSRGSSVLNLVDNSLWFNGPLFLQKDEHHWPRLQHPNQHELPERREAVTTLLVTPGHSMFDERKYINSYRKTIRIFAYVKRFINWYKGRFAEKGAITIEEERLALMSICIAIQKETFPDEYNKLLKKEQLSSSKLNQLSPFIDTKDSIIRVGGRLTNSSLSYETAHPILLPSNHVFVWTLIDYHHRKNMHAVAQTLVSLLRYQIWIVNSRDTIRRVIHRCIICFRCRPKIAEQIMGSLPRDRLEPDYPFAICGVDYCGPFSITQRLRGKHLTNVYVAVFICFTTKAIHLELATDLTTESFISALKRFIARRGKCHTIYSDNATNFVGPIGN